tara:strand:+ start:1210 stop:3663 length:2454 start_codon:yes stop_codon:yes gene_type:complete
MILSKSEYITHIGVLLPDNSTQEISPRDLRVSLVDLVDSTHRFLEGTELNSLNFSTPDIRTTKAGSLALGKLSLAGRSSADNTALGYYALGASYATSGNTALGSYALGCNLTGNHNIGVGLNSTAGNVNGSGNIGVGNYTLYSNKYGDFNIAIGHGAGHFLGDRTDYTLSIGVYPGIDEDHTCDIILNSGAPPLMYGDLLNRKLGLSVNHLHDYGTLQVSGDISPYVSGIGNIGVSQYAWKSVNEVIYFSGGKIGIGTETPSGDQGIMTVKGHLVPNESHIYALGYADDTGKKLLWDGYFNDVVISGRLHANDVNYNNINECLYDCKTLHLATSGLCEGDLGFHNSAVCGYLSDEALDGAGFEVHSSGHDYLRDYTFLFRHPDPSLTCLEVDSHFARARWESNISIEITSGNHLQTDRVLGDKTLSLVTQSGCQGIKIKAGPETSCSGVNFGSMGVIESGFCCKDHNFVSASGSHILDDGNVSGIDLSVMYGSVDSGVQIEQMYASRIKTCETLRGFSWIYHDEIDTLVSGCASNKVLNTTTTTTGEPTTTSTTTTGSPTTTSTTIFVDPTTTSTTSEPPNLWCRTIPEEDGTFICDIKELACTNGIENNDCNAVSDCSECNTTTTSTTTSSSTTTTTCSPDRDPNQPGGCPDNHYTEGFNCCIGNALAGVDGFFDCCTSCEDLGFTTPIIDPLTGEQSCLGACCGAASHGGLCQHLTQAACIADGGTFYAGQTCDDVASGINTACVTTTSTTTTAGPTTTSTTSEPPISETTTSTTAAPTTTTAAPTTTTAAPATTTAAPATTTAAPTTMPPYYGP